jgi:hypothetical protein
MLTHRDLLLADSLRTHLSCRTFAANAERLQLQMLAYNRQLHAELALPHGDGVLAADQPAREAIQDWRQGRGHGRYVTFETAEVAVVEADVRRNSIACGH